jgi:hypothetical protein
MLAERQDGDPHPFVDPEGWTASLDLWRRQAEQKLETERASAE